MALQTLYTSDNGNTFIGKLNSNFGELEDMINGLTPSAYTDLECRQRFIQEMNKKASLLGMTGTTFYDPAGNQPITAYMPNYQTNGYPEAFASENANVMTAMDALRLLIYASGVQHINDAWNIQSFTLNYKNGSTSKTATITSTVFHSSTSAVQDSIDDLLASYEILGGKTGSFLFSPVNANTLVVVARSKSTGKVYACVDFSTTTSSTSSSNKFKHTKQMLDAADQSGVAPIFNQGGACLCILPEITPSLLNRASITTLQSYQATASSYPASVTKVMTAILLTDNILDLNQIVTVHESDRQPPTGTNFVAGDELRVRDLLQCMLMESSNTSAQVIARIVGSILLQKDNNVMV